MVKNMARVILFGETKANIEVNSLTIILKVTESMHGVMVEFTKAPGKTIRWKDKVHLLGQTAESILVTISMTKKKVMVHFFGLMVASTMECGSTENRMA